MPVDITQGSFSDVWPLAKGGVLVAVPGKHLAGAPVVQMFIDSAGSHVCPYGSNAILLLL